MAEVMDSGEEYESNSASDDEDEKPLLNASIVHRGVLSVQKKPPVDQPRWLFRRVIYEQLLYVIIMLTEIVYTYIMFNDTRTKWNNYYFLYLYTPFVIFRIILGTFAFLDTPNRREYHTHTPFTVQNGMVSDLTAMFQTRYYGALARWNQCAVWFFVCLMLLNIRPIWLVGQVKGWRYSGSPCGHSSCTRNVSILNTAIYNPVGWFPHGKYVEYDVTHVEKYTFCNFRDHCHWADSNGNDVITGYELREGSSLINYQRKWNDHNKVKNQGYATQRPIDYPNPGIGLAFGWKPVQRVGEYAFCPGNLFLTNRNASNPSYGYGRTICSTCKFYEEYVGEEGSDDRLSNHCENNAIDSLNVFCGLCPGSGGWFGNPADVSKQETIDPDELQDILNRSLMWAFLPLFGVLLIHIAGFWTISILNDETEEV